MTIPTAPETPAVAPAPGFAPAAAKAPNTIGLVAIILAGVGFLMAVIPPTSGFAWIILLAATILGIVGVTRKGQKKGTSIAAMILGVVGWIVSIVVFFISAAVGISAALDEADDAPAVSAPDSSSEGEAAPAVIGDTVTDAANVSFTVNAMKCGLTVGGKDPFDEKPKGEFCQVDLTIANGSSDSISLSGLDFAAFIGESKYDTESIANMFDDDYYGTDVNPGLSAKGTIFFDVPAGATLDTVQFQQLFSFEDPLVIKVS